MASVMKINGKTVIADILREHPECIDVFDRHSMPCRTCMGVSTDTLEDGSIMHDVNLEVLITELQSCCNGGTICES